MSFFRRIRSQMGAVGSPTIPLSSYRFAAVDLETTGFSARGSDRIVEIGVVTFGVSDGIVERWETVVNPRRDVGATAVHGLTMAELQSAPMFADVRGHLSRLLEGRVLVAHNARFDCGFLEAEFGRSGDELPDLPVVCTMALARQSGLPARLRLLAQHYGLPDPQEGAHSAITDAGAVAEVFRIWCLGDGRRLAEQGLAALGCDSLPGEIEWRHAEPTGNPVPRAEAMRRNENEVNYLSTLLRRLPDLSNGRSLPEAEYLDLLDRALEDRHLSTDEAHHLASFAAEGGMSREDAVRLNGEYFAALVDAAWQDGRVSRAEAVDLGVVARLLDIPVPTLAKALKAPPPQRRLAPAQVSESPVVSGKTVCFTGELRCSIRGEVIGRTQAEELASDRGLVVRSSVTKKLDVLVVADPLSQSAKARKARQYGTRIVAEHVFWRELGVDVD